MSANTIQFVNHIIARDLRAGDRILYASASRPELVYMHVVADIYEHDGQIVARSDDWADAMTFYPDDTVTVMR